MLSQGCWEQIQEHRVAVYVSRLSQIKLLALPAGDRRKNEMTGWVSTLQGTDLKTKDPSNGYWSLSLICYSTALTERRPRWPRFLMATLSPHAVILAADHLYVFLS